MSFDYRKPGVYVEESLLVNSADTASASSIAMFVGAANIGPTDQPVRCDTWSDYVRYFGSFEDISVTYGAITSTYKSYLPYAVYSYFQNGGNPCYVQRAVSTSTSVGNNAYLFVPDASKSVSSNTITTRQIDTSVAVTNKAKTGGVATITIPNHPFVVGQSVTIAGVATTNNGDGFDGTFTILSTTTGSSGTITYAITSGSVSSISASGTATLASASSLVTLTANALDGVVTSVTNATAGYASSTTTVTLTVPTGHGFTAGQSVVVEGINSYPLNTSTTTKFDGTFTLTAVTDTSLSYVSTGPSTPTTVSDFTNASVRLASAKALVEGFTSTDAAVNGAYVIVSVSKANKTIKFEVANLVSSMQTVASSVAVNGSPRLTSNANIAFEVQARSIGTANNTTASTLTGLKGLSLALTVIDTTNGIFDLVVYKDNVEVERFSALSMLGNVSGTKRADIAINDPYSGSSYIRIATYDASATLPATVVNSLTASAPAVAGKFVGGTDSGVPGSIDYQSSAQLAVGRVQGPLLLNLVGYTTDVNDPTKFIAPTGVSSSTFPDRGDVFIINDAVRARNYGESSATYKGIVSAALSVYPGDAYVGAFTPWIITPNPQQSGTTITIPPGGAVAGVMSRVDNTIGVFRAPAGMIAGISNAVGVDAKWSDAELGDFNSGNINVIRPVPGAGISIMGARTRKSYGADRYISARRTLIYIKESLRQSTQFALFENNDQRLWTQLQMTAERILRPLWEAGGLRGANASEAYYIKCDSTVNTPSVIQSGEVRLEIGVALEYPAEFIVIRVSQIESGGFAAEVQPRG